MEEKEKDFSTKAKAWLFKRKWDVSFFIIVGAIVFIPQVRMPVISTVQRILARTPKELSFEKQKTVQSMHWALADLQGKKANLSESQGKVTIINLWATWCPPCVAEMPSLQKLYDHYGNQLDYYFVSHEDPKIIQRFIESKKYTFPVYMPINNPPAEFHSNSLPTTYVLNKEGKIIMEEVGAHNWFSESFQKTIEELLGE